MRKASLRRLAVGGLILLAICGLGAAVFMKELKEGIMLASIVASGLIGFLKGDDEEGP